MKTTILNIEQPQSFKEFLRSTHQSLLESPLDMVDLGVYLDFDLWLKGMNQEELFSWVEAYREDQVFRMWEQVEKVAQIFIEG